MIEQALLRQPSQHMAAKAADTPLLDRHQHLVMTRHHEVLVTVEEGSVGGFGSHVLGWLAQEGLLDHGHLKVRTLTLPDRFIDHNTPDAQYAEAGLQAADIARVVTDALGRIPAEVGMMG